MILQFSIVGFEWVLGVGIAFGLAFMLNYITFNRLSSFFVFLTIFIAFMVWAEMLPLWSLVVCIMLLTIIIFLQMKSQGVSEQ